MFFSKAKELIDVDIKYVILDFEEGLINNTSKCFPKARDYISFLIFVKIYGGF